MHRLWAQPAGQRGLLCRRPEQGGRSQGALPELREILEKVNTGGGTAGLLVNDPSLYHNVKFSLKRVDQATESLEDQGVLTVLGLGIGKLKVH